MSHVFLTVFPWVKGRVSSQSLVSLLKRPENCVEQHLVSCLQRRVQELPRRHVIMASDAADESERAQNLLLGQQHLHDLIVGRGQTLESSGDTGLEQVWTKLWGQRVVP